MSGPTFSQNHSGSGDNNINIGKMPFQLTEEVKQAILKQAKEFQRPFGVSPLGYNPRSQLIAQELIGFLSSQGLDVRQVPGIGTLHGAYGPVYLGRGSITGDLNPFSSDPIIYINADG